MKASGAVPQLSGEREGELTNEEAGRLSMALDRELRFRRIDPSDREEIRQEVLVWALGLRALPGLESAAWVKSVVRLFLRSHLRLKWRRSNRLEPDVPSGILAPGRNPDQELSLAQLLERLKGRDREVIRLLIEGLSWAEALRRVGVPQGSHGLWKRRIREAIVSLDMPHSGT
jgi:DNA-directed RNA polymerase specialized sigma24 family protein